MKFNCKKCKYIANTKQNWKKHLTSKKHVKNSKYFCNMCNKELTSKTSFYRHTNTCDSILVYDLEKENEKIAQLEHYIKKNDYDNVKLKTMVETIVENQKISLKNQDEIKNKKGNTINNLSINVYLNETCKNAMNLKDFMNQVSISLDDLLYTKDNGYVKGISNIFIKNLNDISPKERPICCSNLEKQHFYVKGTNEWEEDEKNKRITQSIRMLSKKQLELTKEWLRGHPNFIDNPVELEEYHLMIKNVCTNGDEVISHDSIIKNVGEHVSVSEIKK